MTRRFKATLALDAVDFALAPGEVVALLGPNGAGKTTLVKILLGLIRADSGAAHLWGRPPTAPASRRRVGAMLQVGRVPELLTVREHVHLFSSYYGSPLPLAEVLALAAITPFAGRRFGELSGGQRQRTLFALAICGLPDLLVLDEPTVGLDVEARREFWSAVHNQIARGCAVLLTTHHLDEADAVADRIIVLKGGHVVADAPPETIKRLVPVRRVRCVTSVAADVIRTIPGVRAVTPDRDGVVVMTSDAEQLTRTLLNGDPALRDLEVRSVGLEKAFLSLTGGSHVDAVSA